MAAAAARAVSTLLRTQGGRFVRVMTRHLLPGRVAVMDGSEDGASGGGDGNDEAYEG